MASLPRLPQERQSACAPGPACLGLLGDHLLAPFVRADEPAGRLHPRWLYRAVFLAGLLAAGAFAAGGAALASAVRSTTESSPPKLLGR